MLSTELQSIVMELHALRIRPLVKPGGEPSPHATPIPSVAARLAAARTMATASPVGITRLAAWQGFASALARRGFDPEQRLLAAESLLRSDLKRGFVPNPAEFYGFTAGLDARAAARHGARLLDDPPAGAQEPALACFARTDAALPEALDHPELWRMPIAVGRSILQRWTPSRRVAFFAGVQTQTPAGAVVLLSWCTHVLPWVPVSTLEAVVELARQDRSAEPVLAAFSRGDIAFDADGVGPWVRRALDASITAKGAAAFKTGLSGVAEHATELRTPIVGCRDLGDVDAWAGASAAERAACAARIAGSLGTGFTSVEDVVVHAKKKLRFRVVPGQEPFLVSERPVGMALKKVKSWVFRGPWRLPTEDELRRAGPVDPPATGLLCADAWLDGAPPTSELARGPGPRVVRRGEVRAASDPEAPEVSVLPTLGLALRT